ncbi:Mediator of RNA polymerase II transcription subunit 19a [Hirschfeldia incana]|nr:Mediator of RNA polymerase II transcription subunit 19a [Hirschfeldia incana]
MEPERTIFGGPRELCGAVDLISQYKLLQHHEFFCKKSLAVSLSDSHYLHNVVGDTEIRKGDGMQLDQLIQNMSQSRETHNSTRIQPFEMDELMEAFQLSDMTPVELPLEEKGAPTIPPKSKSESKDKDRKHKKHKDRGKEKDREHKKHKHRHRDKSKDKDKDKDRDRKKEKNGHHESGEHSMKHHDKKRKHDGDEDLNDIHRHKKNKHKSSKLDEIGAIRVGG